VLITDKSGTGKELVASAHDQHGRRAMAPYLALNCAAITESLLEGELFGNEKGSFTGAGHRCIGKKVLRLGTPVASMSWRYSFLHRPGPTRTGKNRLHMLLKCVTAARDSERTPPAGACFTPHTRAVDQTHWPLAGKIVTQSSRLDSFFYEPSIASMT